MSFSPDPDPLKQPEEVKKNKHPRPDIIFNSTNSKKSFYQKHFGMFLDIKHDFAKHIKGIFVKLVNLLVLFEAPRFVTETISSTNL